MAVTGLDKLNRKLAAMPETAKREMYAALDEGADRLTALMRGLAPVDEGDLHKSIRQEPGRHELAIDIKAGGPLTTRDMARGMAFDYAGKVEREQPFFYPSYRALKGSIRARVSRAVRKSIKGNGNA